MTKALDDLLAHWRETALLGEVAGRLGWDQQAMMPKGAAAQRAEESAAMEKIMHARRTDPRIGEWLAAIDRNGLSPDQTRSVELIEWAYRRATCLSEDLAVAIAHAEASGLTAWEAARAEQDWQSFAPRLAEMVTLKREEASAKSEGEPLWDALAQDYEPGISAGAIDALFDPLRQGLLSILDEIEPVPAASMAAVFPHDDQLTLSRDLAQRFGYDFAFGRIDLATHPFSSGSATDVRITTRVSEADPFNALYSTIHEVGHGAYEQNVASELAWTPLGGGVSMGVHESQSRLFENQLGRSRAFCEWLFEAMQARFGDFGIADGQKLFDRINHVHPGFIRTEADELHYNLHIMMRYDLERDMIEGRLQVTDLEEAWNSRFAADFGQTPPNPALGVLQDIHWPSGAFGYFPTYALGNIYAGCLHAALRADLPDLDAALRKGDPTPATSWLRDKVQRHGRLRPPQETIQHATAAPISVDPLLGYLRAKFLP